MGDNPADKPTPDASGWATKANLLCSDGRTIMPDAFKHQDQMEVPLVYQHDHEDPQNVLGHALLTHKPEGVWADLFFNRTPNGQHMKEAVVHKDIKWMSIFADKLIERAKEVYHGTIREVSLVLAGANPGATIQSVVLEHGDSLDELPDAGIIYTGLDFIVHADGTADPTDTTDNPGDGGKTLQDVYDTLDEDQLKLLHFLLGEEAAQHNTETDPNKVIKHADNGEEGSPVGTETDPNKVIKHNVFEKKDATGANVLVHKMEADDVRSVIKHAASCGSMKEAIQAYIDRNSEGGSLQHGIENLEILFPEARAMTQTPTWDKRRTEWVATVLNGVRKAPFARIKTWTADITYEAARAKGYIKGTMKKEEFFSIAKRETGPTTFYKKQKFDRDDIIDITDFDLIIWVKGEMRLMLEEEFARAILIGDGRDVDDEDKIPEDKIRPIAKDDPYYTITVNVDSDDVLDVIDTAILEREQYKGTGQPTFFTTQRFISRALTKRNDLDQKLYRNKAELAADLDVAAVIPVEVLSDEPDIVGIIVNLDDYSVGTDKGGEVTLFDDFDIDFNQYKYLIEGRSSGALRDPKTAMVLRKQVGDEVTATKPVFDGDAFTITVPDIAGVIYTDQDGNDVSDSVINMDEGDVVMITASADDGKHLANGRRMWSYMRPTGSSIVGP